MFHFHSHSFSRVSISYQKIWSSMEWGESSREIYLLQISRHSGICCSFFLRLQNTSCYFFGGKRKSEHSRRRLMTTFHDRSSNRREKSFLRQAWSTGAWHFRMLSSHELSPLRIKRGNFSRWNCCQCRLTNSNDSISSNATKTVHHTMAVVKGFSSHCDADALSKLKICDVAITQHKIPTFQQAPAWMQLNLQFHKKNLNKSSSRPHCSCSTHRIQTISSSFHKPARVWRPHRTDRDDDERAIEMMEKVSQFNSCRQSVCISHWWSRWSIPRLRKWREGSELVGSFISQTKTCKKHSPWWTSKTSNICYQLETSPHTHFVLFSFRFFFALS